MTPYRIKSLAVALILVWALIGAGCASVSVQKPVVIDFGASQSEIAQSLATSCAEIRERVIEPAQLPNVETQSQIDCIGFNYFGAPRLAEFVFADDALILTWILVEKDDLPALENAFIRDYGTPSFQDESITGFHDAFAAVRKDIPEALYYSPSVAQLVVARMTQ